MRLMQSITWFSRFAGRALILLVAGACVRGQDGSVTVMKTITDYANPPGLAAGTPDGSYALGSAETIDMFSGRLNYELPLLRVGGRGGAGYTMSLKIPSRWSATVEVRCTPLTEGGFSCLPNLYHASFGDYYAQTVGYGPGMVLRRSTGAFGTCLLDVWPNNQTYQIISARTTILYIDAHGSEHELFDTKPGLQGAFSVGTSGSNCLTDNTGANRGRIFMAKDGTAITYISDSDIADSVYLGPRIPATAGRLFFPDGTMQGVDSEGRITYTRDRHGNITTFEYDTTNPMHVTRVVDPENRVVTISYNLPAAVDTITFTGYQGGTQQIVVTYNELQSRLRLDQGSSVATYNQLFSEVESLAPVNPVVPATVTLPNGKQYQFRYNKHAELAEVLLPTGGRYEYDWAGGDDGIPVSGFEDLDDLALIHRVVKQRRAYTVASGGTPVTVSFFEQGLNGPDTYREQRDFQNSPTAPRVVRHDFRNYPTMSSFLQPHQADSMPWNAGKEFMTTVKNAGSVLMTTENEWVQQATHLPIYQTPVIKSTTKTIPRTSGGALLSKTEHQYDHFTNITETTETDWGAGVPGSIVRRKTTTYLTDLNYTQATETIPANYVAHLRRLPVIEKSFSVVNGVSTEEARREYAYDDQSTQPVQPCSGLSRHDTNLPFSGAQTAQYLADNPVRRNTSYTRFGNVTTVTDWLSGSTSISAHARYDLAGNVVRTQDPNQTVATAAYSGACAYPSQVTIEAAPQNFVSEMTWDANTGKLLTLTDAADVETHFGYEAAFGRMTLRTAAANTADADPVSIAYDDNALTVTTSQEIDSQIAHKQSSKEYDGLGRLVWERQKTNGSDIVVKTEYDSLGRVWRRSIPSSNPSEWETFQYDALDRVTNRSWGDGSQEITQYNVSDIPGLNADQTKVTDAAGKWRIMANDALGRLIQIREPNPNNPASPLDTYYTYNSLDNLLTVNQSGRTRSFTYDWMGRLLTAFNPESGTTNYTYDGNGNLTAKSDSRSITTAISYDKLNRPLTKTYTGGATPTVTYTYNGLRLTSVSTSDGIAQSFTYRPSGRIDTSTQTVGGVPYSFAYTYYKDGTLKSVTYPSGRLIEYFDLDRAGRVRKVQGTRPGDPATPYLKAATYNAHGLMESRTFGNNLVERWLYSPKRLLPYRIRLGTSASADSVGRWDFSYCAGAEANVECSNNNGNVMGHAINALGRRQNYSYDALNRISIMDERVSPKASPDCFNQTSVPCRAYSYDDWGNMYVSYQRYLESHPFTPAAASNFDAANRLIIQGSTYDAAGNQTAIGGYTFTYDAENRLKTSTINSVTTTFEYDGEGRRVKKGNEIYVYDAFGNLAAEYGGTPTPVGTQYLTTDHLGSTRVITKQDGTVDRRIDYLPFGESLPTGVSGRTTAMGYQGTGYLGPLKPGFTGKDRDAETGLDYFGARYFSGAQGRFTSPDEPLFDQDETDPQSWNLYSYVRNNPLSFTDPTGRKCVQTNNGWADDGTGGGCDKAGVDAEGNITAQKVEVKGKQGNVVAALGLNAFFALDAAANAWFSPIFGRTSYMQDIPTSNNWTGYAAQAGVFFMPGPGGKSGAAGKVGIWSETKALSRVQNAFSHWTRHRSEFPNLQNSKQYVEAAWDFVTNPPAGVLTKTRANGDTLLYDAATNTFAVKNAQGVPRTMFKPKDGAAYFHTQK